MNTIPIKQKPDTFFQVLINSFDLYRKENSGTHIDIRISDDIHQTIRDPRERRKLQDMNDKSGSTAEVREQLQSFYEDESLLGKRFELNSYRLRYANGGVLPIIRINNIDYVVLFLRLVFPYGWNIANGGSNTRDEINNPGNIVLREFGEELIIASKKEENSESSPITALHVFAPAYEAALYGTLTPALNEWKKRAGQDLDKKNDGKEIEVTPLPIKLLDGPDSITVHDKNNDYNNMGFFASITTEDSAIEVDKAVVISLPDNAVLLDGEYVASHDFLLDRPIGLFKLDRFNENFDFDRSDLTPDKLFFKGIAQDVGNLNSYVDEYIKKHLSVGYRTEEEQSKYLEEEKTSRGLCPITKSVIKKYTTWLSEDKSTELTPPVTIENDKTNKSKRNLFISYRTKDSIVARQIYEHFIARGWSVFFSEISIAMSGESTYQREISKALENADDLIVIASDPSDLSFGWVYYEWSLFLNEILSGRKKGSRLITLSGQGSIDSLPIDLRNRQNFTYTKDSLPMVVSNLSEFLN